MLKPSSRFHVDVIADSVKRLEVLLFNLGIGKDEEPFRAYSFISRHDKYGHYK